MHRLIPHSQLHVYHGGHLELGAGAERLAPVVESFLDTDLTRREEPTMTQAMSTHMADLEAIHTFERDRVGRVGLGPTTGGL
jgi:hypothetical protein